MKRRCLLTCATLAAIALQAAPAHAQFFVPLAWKHCTEGDDDGSMLGTRLQCATMWAPLDHAIPWGARTEVALMRVVASDPLQRQGAVFFHFGGPGIHPGNILPLFAAEWSAIDAADPLRGEQKRVSERYDFVAVVPRGLKGSTPFDCLAGRPMPTYRPTASDTSFYNWQLAKAEAASMANACGSIPFARFVDTGQHVGDMDLARQGMGLERLHFYGTSYGTWVGTWYAAVHPERVGRMLLDSTMDVTATFADAIDAQTVEKHRLFVQGVLDPALAEPALYGLGTDPDEVLNRMRAMPQHARAVWATGMSQPADLAAVMVMSDWLRDDPSMDERELTRKVFAHRFSSDAATNLAILTTAIEHIYRYYDTPTGDTTGGFGTDGLSVNLAVQCSDSPWNTSPDFWWEHAKTNAHDYPGGSDDEATTGLICAQWPGTRVTRPSLTRLGEALPMLMIQAEYDGSTPLSGALRVKAAYDTMHLVVARGMQGHSIIGASRTPCIETTAGHYLLTGELPEETYSACDVVPLPAERSGREARSVDTDAATRRRGTLNRLLRDS